MPTIVSTAAGQYAAALGNSRKLFRDAYGKYIAIYKNSHVMLGYCNNDPPTSGWVDNDLGSSYGAITGEEFGIAAAYDSTNDKLMVIANYSATAVNVFQITFSRDANHNITGYTAGTALNLIATYSAFHNPSLWMLHNGEVACVWGDDKTGGAKHSVVKFCRLVFGSPPTYKNAAGTASQIDTIFVDYTGAIVIRFPTVTQRINAGTGQYDLFAFTTYNNTDVSVRKVKATWGSPNWAWGSEVTSPSNSTNFKSTFSAYDTINGLIVYGTSGVCRTIAADDTDSNVSPPTNPNASVSLAINQTNGDYYIWYPKSLNVYYQKRSSGSWGSETRFTTTANENYPSCKVDGAGNKIELIWTHYTGSAYNVYYDYLSLAAGVTYPVSVSELLGSPSDSVSYSVRRAAAVSESLGSPSDAVTRVLNAFRTVSEASISASDALTAGLFKSISVSEPLGSSSDSVGYTLRRTVSISEPSISMSDSPTYTLRRDKAVSEPTITVSDGIVRVLWAYRTVSEPSISASDAVTRGLFRSISVSETSISVTDSTGYMFYRGRVPSESLGSVSDIVGYNVRRVITISEPSISISDSPARGLFRSVSISEPTVSVSDSPTYNIRRIISISEPSITVSDGVTRFFWGYRTISEPSISVSDSVARGLFRAVTISEASITFSDSTVQVLRRSVTISEPTISVSDSLSYNLRRVASISEPSITVSDSIAAVLCRLVSISETSISVSDSVVKLFWAYRTLQEPTISAADSVSAEKYVIGLERSVSEPSISVSDSLSYVMIRGRMITEPGIPFKLELVIGNVTIDLKTGKVGFVVT